MMADLTTMTEEDIPSRRQDLLISLRSAPIARMTRYSWSPKETVGREDNLRSELVFSRTAGPLLITLESGLVIAASSQPSLISVTLWLDQPPRISSDPELHPIEANDPQFSEPGFAQMLGKRAGAVAILTRDAENAKWESRPREVGVLLRFEGAPDLILSHGLHDNSDDFSVLMHKDVSPSLWPRLHEVHIA
jgi:hypothetical protein